MSDPGLLAAPRLTPENVRRWDLPRVIRGYDIQSVEDMRRAVIDEMSTLLTELRDTEDARFSLAEEVDQLRHQQQQPRPAPPQAGVGDQAVRILRTAQQQAEQIIGEAQGFARQVGSDGERQRRVMLEAARSRADALVDEARQKSEELAHDVLRDAQSKAAAILSQAPIEAQTRVASLEALGGVLESHLSGVMEIVNSTLRDLQKRMAEPLRDYPPVPA